MMKLIFTGLLLAAGSAVLAAGEALPPSPKPSPIVGEISACRSVGDSAQRLACYDRAAAHLDAARKNHEIVVIDKAEVRKTRRTLFGLALPRLDIFSSGDKKEDDREEIREITAKVAAASIDGEGNWLVRLEDGAKWRQTDGKMIATRPHPGSTVLIRHGALGSFVMRVDGQPGVKVRREN